VIRGLGWLPDLYDRRDLSIERLGLTTETPSSDLSLRPFTDGVVSQGLTSSCVGQSVADACDTTWRAQGIGVPERTSALAIYGFARAQHTPPEQKILPDFGTYIRDAIRGMKKHGRPPENAWPFDLSKIEQRPPLSVIRAGYDTKGPAGYYRIFGSESSLLSQIDRALASGFAVVFGVPVDLQFTNDIGPELIRFPDSANWIGGHAMEVIGRIFRDGVRWYEIKQTWGETWREEGFAFLHQRWLTEGYDHWVIAP